jgi:hypothetical protein
MLKVPARTLSAFCLLPVFILPLTVRSAEEATIYRGNVGGYTSVGKEKVDDAYDAGYSMYSAAWPLLPEYPGHQFQSGLFGTWLGVQNDRPSPIERFYTKIEGGLGWWRDTEYPTETPKFIMGGVELNFRGWANGPGAGQGRDWSKPKGKYGVAQLSPWLLWPPDGLNLKQGTCGELFGSGYLPLPLIEAKSTTADKDVPTGDQCWTLFLNTANFKGPVAFFTPYFWSRASVDDPRLSGMFFDSRPSKGNKPFSMETQHIHCAQATDSQGQTYARMIPPQYPVGADGNSVVMHRLSVYNRKALWDGVKAWFAGGDPVDGVIDPAGTHVESFNGQGGANWRVYMRHVPKEKRARMATDAFMNAQASDSLTFRFQWDSDLVTQKESKEGSMVTLPEYYHLAKDDKNENGKWLVVAAKDVPAETGLHQVSFSRPQERPPKTYVTPGDAASCWKTPGPVAGPFKARPGDGSTVTYYWYRFADQPALLNANLTDQEREILQTRVEKLHRHWTKDRNYLAAPTVGTLAHIAPALIVTPPKGMELGYVPIATRQGMAAE